MHKTQAENLARKIEDYWKRMGFAVKATVAKESDTTPGRDGSDNEWTIRTDPPLRNGLPQGATRALAKPILRAFDRQHTDWRKFDDERPENN